MSERLLRWFTAGQIADVNICTGQPPNILFRNADLREPDRMTEGTDKSAEPIGRCAQNPAKFGRQRRPTRIRSQHVSRSP